jgi:hypothetical protein
MATDGAMKAARVIFQAFIRRPDSANVDTWAETIDREAVAPLREALQLCLKHFSSEDGTCVECGEKRDIYSGCETCFALGKAEAALKLAGGE